MGPDDGEHEGGGGHGISVFEIVLLANAVLYFAVERYGAILLAPWPVRMADGRGTTRGCAAPGWAARRYVGVRRYADCAASRVPDSPLADRYPLLRLSTKFQDNCKSSFSLVMCYLR